MNERIRELLLQATTLRGPPFIRFKVDQEKFAELIVRECKAVILDMMDNKQGDFVTLDLALTEINEHFGVEE